MKWGPLLALWGFATAACAQEYGGPAILSRGEAPAAMSTPEIDFRPFVGFYATYSSGLANVTVNNEGGLANESSFGGALTWGISGTHSWRHTKLGLNYGGSLAHYIKQTAFDSISQSFMMGLSHRARRHVMLSWRNSLGVFSRVRGERGLQSTLPFDPATTYTPVTDFFDNRTLYLSTQADMTYQKSARLSFNMGGDGFVVRRRSRALYGVLGGGARGDIEYRLTRQSTLGVQYSFMHYDFTKIFGGTDLHGVAVNYGVRLTKQLEFSMYGGFYRVESKFIEEVPIDPVIAALLGISSAERVSHNINYVPNVSGRLSRTFSKGVGYLSAGRSVTPGNGLFLTSISDSVVVGYGYSGLRRWTIGASVNYSRAESLGNIRGRYSTIGGIFSLSRSLGRMMHLSMDYSVRQYESPTFQKYNRLVQSAGIGIIISPGDSPLHIW